MDRTRLIQLIIATAALFAVTSCGPEPSDENHDEDTDWKFALDDVESGALMNVWGPNPERVYAVGGQPDAGIAFVFDGDDWNELNLPETPMLNWVHGTATTTWIVGREGYSLRLSESGDDVFETGVDVDLWGVWAADEDNVFAVGGDARDVETKPVILYFDGDQWSDVEVPELDRDTNAFFKVWGTAADNVFVVGARGVILHFDGQDWEQMSSGTGEDFVSLWGRSEDDIVAVGGRGNGVIARYDGTEWTSQLVGGSPALNGVWMDSDGVAHANGVDGYTFYLEPGSFEPNRETTPTSRVLHGIFGFDDGPRFGVGGTLNSSPPYLGVAIESREK